LLCVFRHRAKRGVRNTAVSFAAVFLAPRLSTRGQCGGRAAPLAVRQYNGQHVSAGGSWAGSFRAPGVAPRSRSYVKKELARSNEYCCGTVGQPRPPAFGGTSLEKESPSPNGQRRQKNWEKRAVYPRGRTVRRTLPRVMFDGRRTGRKRGAGDACVIAEHGDGVLSEGEKPDEVKANTIESALGGCAPHGVRGGRE